jgi:hypothetical protein
MAWRALREELEQLEAQVGEHPAQPAIQRLEELDRAMRWCVGNADACLQTIDALNHDGLGMRLLTAGEVPYGDELHRNVVELGRAWHNFVAGAQTFADHMRCSSTTSLRSQGGVRAEEGGVA